MAAPQREPTGEPPREPAQEPHREEVTHPTGYTRAEAPRYFDMIRWGPVFAGALTALAVIVTLDFLGVAVGLSTVGITALFSATAIWTIISLMIGLFVGGWLAAATSGPTGVWDGIYEGIVVWGVTLLVIALAVGFGVGGFFGAFMVTDLAALTAAAWGLFFATLLGLGAAILGGIAGAARETSYRV